jgi:hypothetical protein
MKSRRHLIRIVALVGACLAGTAFAGLSLARTSSHASAKHVKQAQHAGQLCVRYDTDDPQAQCLRRGPVGRRGPRGAQGPIGVTGARGPVGLVGPVGAVGPQGPIGAQGAQGSQGIQGPNGAHVGGGNTQLVLGSKIGPIPFTANAPGIGTELTPSVARCPTAGANREAFDGGAIISTANPNQPGLPTGDVVGLEGSYPGLYAGPTEVDPLPLGGTPGAVSPEAANAYQAQAVITQMHSGDNVTVQAYVICGP